MDVMAILGLKVQSTKASDLEQQNQNTNCLLLREPEWRESLVNPQCMVNDLGPTYNSMSLQHDDTLKESQEQNAQLRHEMTKQAQIILELTKKHTEAVGRFEQHRANITYELEEQKKKVSDLKCQKGKLVRHHEEQTKRIFDLECQKGKLVDSLEEQTKRISELECQKGMLVHSLEEQTRIASALEKRDAKMKEVFSNISSTMFLELEYQEELINEMTPDEGEFFQPSHNTLVDLVEIIEQWTADDKHSEMMFNLEDEPQFEQLYAELLSRFNEQSCQLKMQAMKLNRQKSMIDEQRSTIFELEAQKRKLAGDLEEQDGKVASLLECLEGNGVELTFLWN
ncbi:hypothetical protein N7465_007705 [Penicillium sp. CMV-2018d]|nr:hypothetical protein N7465_007705 [Penicillium sp. CMV-2018d]